MSLLDRIGADLDNVAVHDLADALFLWADPGTAVTRAQVIAALGLQASDEAQLDELAAGYAAQPTDHAKLLYVFRTQAVMRLLERGHLTTTQAATFLELTE